MKRSRINPYRKTLRRNELTPAEKEAIRLQRFKLDGYRCVDCGIGVIWEAGCWCSGHLMHVKSKGSGGSWDLSNLRTGCLWCHGKRHNSGGKVVPSKAS